MTLDAISQKAEKCANSTESQAAASLFDCAYEDLRQRREAPAALPAAGVDSASGVQTDNVVQAHSNPSNPVDKLYQSRYQEQMLLQLQLFSKPSSAREGETADQARARNAVELAQRKERIREEMHRGEFGPASQAAFKEYTSWIGKVLLPTVLRQLESRNLAVPTDSPFEVQTKNGVRVSANETITDVLSSNQSPFERLGSEIPNRESAQRIENAFDWLGRATNSIIESENKAQDSRIERTIRESGLPHGWLYQEGQDRNAWRAAAAQMIDLALRVGSQVNMIEKYGLNIPMPAGTKVENVGRGQTVIQLDLPHTLELNKPENVQKISAIKDWQKSVEKQMNEVDARLTEVNQTQRNIITWGDAPIPGTVNDFGHEVWAQARIGADNRMIGLIDPDKPGLKPNERAEAVNLMEARFSVTSNAEGNIEVSQTLQPQFVPIYGYLNMVYSNVGAPIEVQKRTFKPDELVAVKRGNGMEFILAKDLAAYKSRQEIAHYGEKALTAITDVAMLASGHFELAVALRGARAAAAVGQQVGIAELRGILMGGLNTGLGYSSPLNSAYFHATEGGRTSNELRNLLFVATAAYGLTRAGVGYLPGQAAKLETEGARNAVLASQSSRLAQRAERVSQNVMHLSQIPMLPMMGSGIASQMKEIWGHKTALSIADAGEAFQAQQQRSRAESGIGNRPVESYTADTATVERFKNLFSQSAENHASNERVTQIFEKLAQAVSSNATPEQREALKRELAANLVFTTQEMELLRTANRRSLTQEQYAALINKETRAKADVQDTTKFLAERFLSQKDQNVVTASQVGLLMLAGNSGDKTLAAAAAVEPPRPSVLKDRMAGFQHNGPINFAIDTNTVVASLRNSLTQNSANGRGEVIANTLLRSGVISPQQYGAVLQNVLQNPEVKPEDKMRAMLGASGVNLAAIVGGMIDRERQVASDANSSQSQRDAFMAENFGSTATDFINGFAKVAAQDGNSDVRAMAAALNYSLKVLQENRELGVELLDQMISLREATYDKGASGFAEAVIGGLSDAMKDQAETTNSRIAAAQALSQLSAGLPSQQVLQSEIISSIAKIATSADAHNLAQVIGFISAGRYDTLDAETKNQIANRGLNLISTPHQYDAAREKELMAVVKSMPILLNNANEEQRASFIAKAVDILQNSHRLNSDLRVASINVLNSMGEFNNIALLRSIAQSDSSASARLAALKALESRDTELSSILPQMIVRETDITVSRALSDMLQRSKAAQTTDSTSAFNEIENFYSGDQARYPGLQGFDAASQRAWLNSIFPLLVNENFISTVEREGRRQTYSAFGQKNLVAAQAVEERKYRQFQLLAELASGDAGDVNTQKARQVLAAVIASNGQSLDTSATKVDLGIFHVGMSGATMDVKVVSFNEKSRNWAREAADALAAVVTNGNTGIDLTARLIAQSLASTKNPEARESLKRAWEQLNSASSATSTIPLRVRKLVSGLAA